MSCVWYIEMTCHVLTHQTVVKFAAAEIAAVEIAVAAVVHNSKWQALHTSIVEQSAVYN